MGETIKINKLIIETGGNEYEFDGGGGGVPGPDTVGTEEIKDGAVIMDDLNDSVKEKITNTYSANDRRLTLGNVVHTDSDTEDVGHQEDNFEDD